MATDRSRLHDDPDRVRSGRAVPGSGVGTEPDPLEAELDDPVRSLAEEGAVARATTDRLRSDADQAWNRALTATQRRDALVAQKRRLVATRRAMQARVADQDVDGHAASSPDGPEWTMAAMKADVFKALAHPARVRVLETLVGGEHSVGRLADTLGMEISHLSHQLAVLRRAELVDRRRAGSVVYYSLRQPLLSRLLAMVAGELLWEVALTAD